MSDFSIVHVPLDMLGRKVEISLADCDSRLDGVGTPMEFHFGNLLIYLVRNVNLMSIIPGRETNTIDHRLANECIGTFGPTKRPLAHINLSELNEIGSFVEHLYCCWLHFTR